MENSKGGLETKCIIMKQMTFIQISADEIAALGTRPSSKNTNELQKCDVIPARHSMDSLSRFTDAN